jgi:uncharacterized protein (DUF427 family)
MSKTIEQPATSPGWPKNPDYVIDFDPVPARVAAWVGDTDIAESDHARVMFELGHAPMYYMPQDDLRMDLFSKTDHKTFCPYKGIASYWSVTVGGKTVENAVWSYLDPYPQMAALKGHMGFYWGRMDRWTEDGETVSGPREIPGRIDTTNQFKALFPGLVKEWHPTRNKSIGPYEFAAESNTQVWWQDAGGREWQERIKDRVLKATTARADGDATPYG